MKLWSAVEFSHRIIREFLPVGGIAVDATMGNGRDTLFLAQCTSASGLVIATDIQLAALEKTTRLLSDHSLLQSVRLLQRNHDDLEEILSELNIPLINCAMFNLGYLPGGDKNLVTGLRSTVNALRVCSEYLITGGVMTVVVYPGHPGGDAEANAVIEFVAGLSQNEFESVSYSAPAKSSAPECIAILKNNRDAG